MNLTPEQRTEELDKLADQWTRIKAHEDAAKAERIEVEEKMLALFEEPDGGEGTVSQKSEKYRLAAGYGVTRTVLQDKVNDCFGDNTDENQLIAHIFPTQHKLDLKQLRAVEIANPALYNRVCQAISAKPKKTSMRVSAAKG